MRRTTTTEAVDDGILIGQTQSGQVSAFERLMRRYQDRVYNVCRRISGNDEDASDLTQETFFKAFQSIETFQRKSSFYTWLFRIAVNLSLTHRRKHRLRVVSTLSEDAVLTDSQGVDGDSTAAAELELHEFVAEALASLEPDHRAVLVLRDIEGSDYQQIADILDIPRGTVKSRVHRARAALREKLDCREGEHDPIG